MAAVSKQENAIVVDHVKKHFKVFLDKGQSFKERLLFRKRRRYENRQVLRDISFTVKRGEAVGLIGHNGCGKSTTLKLLTRILYPDSGTITIQGRVSSLIELGAGFHPDMSGRENIYTNASIFGLSKKEIDARLQTIIDFSELEPFIDNPVRTYSSGMYMRLAFSVAINVDADVLLIDEILGVGDVNFQAKCFQKLQEIKADGTINIGVFSDKNPFGYVDENGEYQGYDIYFANRLAEDLGVKVNYVSTEAANRIEYLQTGKVDVILANFTVTPERAEEVDFALPYMNVALGVVSPDSNVITSLDSWNADDQMIVISGTTAETYLTQNYPDIPLQKYDSYATAKSAMENGGVAWANDNTEVIAFASQNPGYTVGIPSLGSQDTIAPAVSKGNETLLNAINDEIKALGKENFFHADYEATLVDTYGTDYEDSLVVEGGETSAQ